MPATAASRSDRPDRAVPSTHRPATRNSRPPSPAAAHRRHPKFGSGTGRSIRSPSERGRTQPRECAQRWRLPTSTSRTVRDIRPLRKPARLVQLPLLAQDQGGLGARRDEGGVVAADRLEPAAGVEQLCEPAGQVAAQDAQARVAVAQIEQAGAVGAERPRGRGRPSTAAASATRPAPSACRRETRWRDQRSAPRRPNSRHRPVPHGRRLPPHRGPRALLRAAQGSPHR